MPWLRDHAGNVIQSQTALSHGDVVFERFIRTDASLENDDYHDSLYYITKGVKFLDDDASVTA